RLGANDGTPGSKSNLARPPYSRVATSRKVDGFKHAKVRRYVQDYVRRPDGVWVHRLTGRPASRRRRRRLDLDRAEITKLTRPTDPPDGAHVREPRRPPPHSPSLGARRDPPS